jgi:hypothetical protein
MPPTITYLQRIAQQGIVFDLGLAPPVGGVANRRRQVAQVQVPAGDARGWRVVLSPLTIAEPAPGMVIDFTSGIPNKPMAHVRFGTDGITQDVSVDWPIGGGMFSVWGDNVLLECQIPDTWITGLLPASVNTGGIITPESGVGGLRATKSAYSGLVAGGGAFSAGIAVPRFAKSFRWHQAINLSATNAAAPMTWFGTIDSALAAPTQTTPDGVYTSAEQSWPDADGIPLLPDTRFLVFQNNAPIGDSVSVTVEFCLDLG